MGSRVQLFAAVLAALCGATGCGSSDASTNGSNGGSGGGNNRASGGSASLDSGVDPELQAFCQSLVALSRARAERCTSMPAAIAQSYVPDFCPNLTRAVTSGKLSFDGAAAATCITDLQSLACDADSGPASCDQVLWGTVADGAACSMLTQSQLYFTECQAGSACIAGNNPCEGTCVKRALLGQQCGSSVRCIAGETCSVETATCIMKGGANAPCGMDSSPECQSGFACSDLFDGICTALLPAGQSCGSSAECAPPLVCDRGAAITGTCQTPLEAGDSCTVDQYECDTGLGYCGSDSKCHVRPGLGQPCAITDGEGTSCVFGTCDTTTSPPVCKAFAAGQECSVNADCGPDALCALDLSTFTPRCTASCL